MLILHFSDEGTEAQRGQVTCPRSQTWFKVTGLGFGPGSFWLQGPSMLFSWPHSIPWPKSPEELLVLSSPSWGTVYYLDMIFQDTCRPITLSPMLIPTICDWKSWTLTFLRKIHQGPKTYWAMILNFQNCTNMEVICFLWLCKLSTSKVI